MRRLTCRLRKAINVTHPFLRPHIDQIPHAYHGAIDFAELEQWGIAPQEILDFSVNSNPFGHETAVRQAIDQAPLHRYPDKDCLMLRRAIAAHLGVADIDQILVGNGTAELLWLICFACVQTGDKALILSPTFGEYGRMVSLMGGEVITVRASEEMSFVVDEAAVTQQLQQHNPKLCFLCNPNNPTGAIVSPKRIHNWAKEYPQTLFVIDEAYINFVPTLDSVINYPQPNLISLRSMTKDYALAGLRLGYMVGEPALVQGIGVGRVPWSVSEPAQAAGCAALALHPHFAADWEQLAQATHDFRQALIDLGYQPLPSSTNYFLLPVGNGRAFRQHMLRHAILVRLGDSYLLPHMVRVATQTPEMNALFLVAIQKWQAL